MERGSVWWPYLYSAAAPLLLTWEWEIQAGSSFIWPTGHPWILPLSSSLLARRPNASRCLFNPFPWNEPARCCTVNASCKTKDWSSSPVESGARAWKKRFRGHGLPQEHSMCPINVTARLSVCRDFTQDNRREWIFLDIFGGALRLKK